MLCSFCFMCIIMRMSKSFWNISDSSVSGFQEYRKDSETGKTTADSEKDVVTREVDLYNDSSEAQSNGARSYNNGIGAHLYGTDAEP